MKIVIYAVGLRHDLRLSFLKAADMIESDLTPFCLKISAEIENATCERIEAFKTLIYNALISEGCNNIIVQQQEA